MPVKIIKGLIPTTTYHITGPSSTCPLFVLIPGNPGLAQFYSLYLDSIKEELPNFEIVALSLLGFDSALIEKGSYDSQRKVYNLQDQIHHVSEMIKVLSYNEENKTRQIYLAGHSVGAWIAQRVAVGVKDTEFVDLKFVGLLTPTIKDIALSDSGRKFTKLANYLPIETLAGRLLQGLNWLLPGSSFPSLVNLIVGSDKEEHAHEMIDELVTRPQIARQVIIMAKEEMKAIDGELFPKDINGFWDENQSFKVWGFFAPKDHWISDTTRDELVENFKNRSNVTFSVMNKDMKISHNFCVTNSQVVAHYTVRAIKSVDEIESR